MSLNSALNAPSLVAQIADNLRDAILTGELAPGARIRQAEYADRLGVSRTPLREALVVLENEGLIVARQRQGVRVTEVTAAEAEELVIMRLVLEPLAVRLSAAAHDDGEVDAINELQIAASRELITDADFRMADAANRDLHFALYGIGQDLLPKQVAVTIEQNWGRFSRYRRLYWTGTPRVDSTSVPDHSSLVDAWIAREADRVEREMAHHILAAVVALTRQLDEGAQFSAALRSLADKYEFDLLQ